MSEIRCNICFLPIHDERKMIRCPRCLNDFHRDHLAAWLLDNSTCPVCRQELSGEFREELRPKTEKDRRRLVQIQQSLSNLSRTVDMWERQHRSRGKDRKRLLSLGNVLVVGFALVLLLVISFILSII